VANVGERRGLIARLEEARDNRTLITYVTSTRPGLESQMAMDVVPVIYQHLKAIATPPEETKIDLFIYSNGGDGIVPWRLVTLIREFCSEFDVLVPFRAFSAATLTALGADHVVMHPMGMLGPTDPTVTNPFNPPSPQNPGQLLGISVEDVASYINLVKEDVGIRHEDELVQAFKVLAEKIHPLALGAVKRATSQSRMMGGKLLRQKALEEKLDEREVEEIIEKLASQLYFHGHPISRKEARDDLRLIFVQDASQEVETAMWNLYESYADDMQMDQEFQPLQEVYAQNPLATPPPGGPPNVVSRLLDPLPVAYVESQSRSDKRTVSFEVTVRKEWQGELNANLSLVAGRWESDTKP